MPLAPAAASDRELDLLRQINTRMLPTIVSEATFRDAGVPMVAGVDLPTPIDWLARLQTFVSEQGLIHELAEYPTNEEYEAALQARLEVVVDDLELPDAPHVLVQVFQLMMAARSAQQSLVWESLAATFGGSAELNQEVLAWAGGSSYQLLGEVLRLFDGSDAEPLPIPVGDEVLALFSRLSHRMGIVGQLSLSPLAVRCWRRHRDWFDDASADDDSEVTFAQLYLLSRYRFLLEFTRQAEQALLDYLKLVDDLPPDLTEQDLQLIREDAASKIALFTGLGIRDILDTALEITDNGIIATVRQLDHLVRVRQTCDTLQLGTSAALALSRLRGNGPREAYRAAAEAALGSLVEAAGGAQPGPQGELGQSEASWMVVDTQVLVANTDAKARYLLTVKDFLGRPLEGITVTWHTDFSLLDTPSSLVTDANGQVRNELFAGTELGTAQVIARFGLDRQVLAPLVQIDCDDASLVIQNPVFDPQEALAGNLQAIEYRLRIQDENGNPARDRIVEWSTDLGQFERPQTRTDADGFATAQLRSLSSGPAVVVVDLPQNGEQHIFTAVSFIEQEYFQYVRFSGPVAATQPAVATARVVKLDGSPRERVTVLWEADFGELSADRSITDDNGIATIEYTGPEPGEVTLTVGARLDNKDLQKLSSERTTVFALPTMVDMQPAEQYFVVHQPHPASFQLRMEPPAAGYPVTWWSGEELLATTSTDRDGVTSYQCHFKAEHLGEQTITVRSLRENEKFDFKVRVVTPHTALLAEKGDDSLGMDPVDPAQAIFAVDPGLSSKVRIRALRSDGSGDNECRLTYSLGTGADPQALGVTFSPAFGKTVSCDEDGNALLSIDCTQAAFLANSDPSSNEIVVRVVSNLNVALEIRLRLRYLMDLERSELHFFRGTVESGEVAALSGLLRRRNGNTPLSLREGERRLQLTLQGAPMSNRFDLLMPAAGGVWFNSGTIIGGSGELGSSCSFETLGELTKRIHFAGTNVFEAKEVIEDAVLSLTQIADPGLIDWGNHNFNVDHGDSYGFTLTLANAAGPIAGVWLSPVQSSVNGMVYRVDGPTDDKGQVVLHADTAGAVLGREHGTSIELAQVSLPLKLRSSEWAEVQMGITITGQQKATVTAQFKRREGKQFRVDGFLWTGLFDSFLDSREFSANPSLNGFTVSVSSLGVSKPGTQVYLRVTGDTMKRVLLTGQTQIIVPENLSEGDVS
ncbi:Ig-like domain-containing protein [Pseudomonas japonica]